MEFLLFDQDYTRRIVNGKRITQRLSIIRSFKNKFGSFCLQFNVNVFSVLRQGEVRNGTVGELTDDGAYLPFKTHLL